LTDLEFLLFVPACVCVGAATGGYLLSLIVKKVQVARVSTWILTAGFALLTLGLILAAFSAQGWGGFGSRRLLSVYAWAVSGLYLALQFKTRTRVLGAFIAPVILVFLIVAAGQGAEKNLVPPAWQGWLTVAHLVLAIAGEALFVLASAAGAMFILQNRLIKHKKTGSMIRFLPSLSDLDRINHIGLLGGFVLLTLGMVGGSVYAAFVWEGPWASDPKVIWTFAVWAVYGILLHQRLAIGWRGVRMAVLSGTVFLLFAASALVIRFCLPTIHSFI